MAGMDEFSASARMNQYETGKHTPDYSMLTRIAEALKTPTAYFYTDNDLLAKLIKDYSSLDKDKKNKILKIAENMKHK